MESKEEIRKPFIVANVRELLVQFNRAEISFSFMVEKLNEMAFAYTDKKNLKLENELADSRNITDNLRNGNLVISRNRGEMEASYEKCNKDSETILAIADEMAGDLIIIEQSNPDNEGFESLAKFYNFKHNQLKK